MVKISIHTGSKISNQSDIPAVILLDQFSKNNKTTTNSTHKREREVHVCVLDGEGNRVFASMALVVWIAVYLTTHTHAHTHKH